MKRHITNLAIRAEAEKLRLRSAIFDNSGQGAIDTAIIVLLSVVLGALLLAGLYALLKDTVLPSVTQKVQELFNYSGS